MSYDIDPIEDARRHAPAAERNAEAIGAVLARLLPATGTVLEISSGTGQHAAAFSAAFPDLIWQPSDIDPGALISIEAWRKHAALSNFHAPVDLDVLAWPWPVPRADALFCANMIHIAPWLCCAGLFEGAGRLLSSGAPLILYGPFKIDGAHTAPSNARFDQSLRDRHSEWGVRNLDDVITVAETNGFRFGEKIPMPANNFCVAFVKSE